MMPVPDPHPDVFDIEWPLRVADVDRTGRLKFDAATRHIQDIGSDQLREMGYEETVLRSGFTFRNPNQTSACGCGESVELKPAERSRLEAAEA